MRVCAAVWPPQSTSSSSSAAAAAAATTSSSSRGDVLFDRKRSRFLCAREHACVKYLISVYAEIINEYLYHIYKCTLVYNIKGGPRMPALWRTRAWLAVTKCIQCSVAHVFRYNILPYTFIKNRKNIATNRRRRRQRRRRNHNTCWQQQQQTPTQRRAAATTTPATTYIF